MRRALARILTSLLVPALLAPAIASAQLAPDSPRLVSPHGSSGLGVHWVRTETLPGDDGALLMTWALPGLPDGIRLRGGVGRGVAGTNAFFGGIDVQAPLMRGTTSRPFDLDWQSGAGVSAGEYLLVTVPLGLSGSVSWTSGAVWIAPYATVGLAADLRLGGAAPDREFQVSPAMDVGLDLAFDVNRRVVIRTAASLGDRQSISLGVGLGLGRLAPTRSR